MQFIWNTDYKIKNIQMLVETAILSALAANFLAPVIMLFVVYTLLPSETLIVWMMMHIVILISRLFVRQKILNYLDKDDTVNKKHTNILLFLTSFTAFMYTYIIWVSVAHNASTEDLFLISSIILVLSSGSISTLMSVFHFFAIFVLISMLSIISAVFYYGGYFFYIYGVLLIVFTMIFLRAGYQQYTLIDNLLSLKNAFQSIYDKSSDGICLIKGHNYKDCNPAYIQMFQYDSKEELFATNISELMPKYQENGQLSLKEMLKVSKETLQNGYSSCEWMYKKKDGTILWTEIVFTKVHIDGEELIHGVFRDITTKKELEKQKVEFYNELEIRVHKEVEKNREKDQAMLHQSKLAQMGEMISMIAHQWRQPLSAISATSGSLSLKSQIGTLNKEITIELSNKITEYAQHLSTTIDDFRNFFKENKTKESTTLKEMVVGTLNIVEVSLKNANIEIEIEEKSVTQIETYINEVKQVILNIIKNAEDVLIDKKIQNPKITINIDGTTLSISDNAGGIPQEIMEKIFEPYFSTKIEKNGTGLGLYMSKTIIEDHCHGTLSVKNSKDGAIFQIKLQQDHSCTDGDVNV